MIVAKVLTNFFYIKTVASRYINTFLEKCGLNIYCVYDDKFKKHTWRYYFCIWLSCITGNKYAIPNARYTIKYILDGTTYRYCFPAGTITNYNILKNRMDAIILKSTTCTPENLWDNFVSSKCVNDKSKYKLQTSTKNDSDKYKILRISNIESVRIDKTEYKDVFVKYINSYYMLNESLCLANIIYAPIEHYSVVTIITKQFGTYKTKKLYWCEIKDVHVYFLFD